MMKAKLKICDLRTQVFLGVGSQEILHAQEISINFVLHYNNPPQGCYNDNINDTICYDKLCSLILNISSSKNYRLIEHLAYNISENIKSSLISDYPSIVNNFKVEIIKLNPPIPQIKQGARFSIICTI